MKTGELLAIVSSLTAASPLAAAEQPLAAPPIESAAPAPGQRLVSPRVAAMLAAAMPRFEPADSASPNSVSRPIVARADETPANAVVRLPNFIVRERKLPTPMEVNKTELARQAMELYLGPEDGFDRGFLNLFTSKQIPLLALFGSVPNEARAMARYREDERLRMKTDLMELAALTKAAGDAAGAAKLKREVQNAFRHD